MKLKESLFCILFLCCAAIGWAQEEDDTRLRLFYLSRLESDVCTKVLDSLDLAQQIKGWEWTYYDESWIKKQQHYPNEITYYQSGTHPAYQRIGETLFQGLQKPLRRISLLRGSYSEDVSVSYLRKLVYGKIVLKDFRDNKYGIQGRSVEVRNAVLYRLGVLSQQHESEDADRYLRQLKEDHANDLDVLLRIRRLSGFEFELAFINADRSTLTIAVANLASETPKIVLKPSVSLPASDELLPPPPPLRTDITFTTPVITDDGDVSDSDEMKTQEEQHAATPSDDQVYEEVEQQAEYPGGAGSMFRYLAQNLIYPQMSIENGTQGRVIVRFMVRKDGSISEISIVRSVDPYIDKEAIRLVKSMPKWKPAQVKGKPVNCWYALPINFKFE